MNKHAYLIIAHNQETILQYLLMMIDDNRNDIFINIDKKSKYIDINKIKNIVSKSKIKCFNDMDVRWGDKSQVYCEIRLLEEARKSEKYQYYHIISGVDLPIKSQNEIHKFFDKNNGKEFIHFDSENIGKDVKQRVYYRHFFSKYYKISKNKCVNKIISLIDYYLVLLQKFLFIKKKIPYSEIQKGCNWCSITSNFVDYILKNKNNISKLVSYSKCADEIFIQTLAIQSEFKNKLYRSKFDNNYDSCKRLIIWDNVKRPKTITIDDKAEILNSNCMFARKFSYNTKKEKKIVDFLLDYNLKGEKNEKNWDNNFS